MQVILSIDGGGVRGIIPATILNFLEKKISEIRDEKNIKIASLFDFIAGTSSGALIGALMLLPDEKNSHMPKYSMQDIINLHLKYSGSLFSRKLKHSLSSLFGLIGPRFPSRNLEEPLFHILDHYKMEDLIKPCLFTAYDIKRRRVKIFTNGDSQKRYSNYYLKDILRGACSIPGLFPPSYFREGIDINTIIDGGIFAGNPSMIAYTEASKTYFKRKDKIEEMDPNKMFFISIGSGDIKKKEYTFEKTSRWGRREWMLPIMDITMSASIDIVNHQMQHFFASYGRLDNYKRINPPLPSSQYSLLDGSKENLIGALKDVNRYLEENEAFFNTLAREICDLNYLYIGRGGREKDNF